MEEESTLAQDGMQARTLVLASNKPMMKSHAKCRMFLCTRPTVSGKAEPLETRYCKLHSPEQTAKLEAMLTGPRGRARTTRRFEACFGPKVKRKGSPCGASATSCSFGPSWCRYTRQPHWYWTRTARARCESWGALIAGIASRIPFNPRFPY